MRVLVTRPMADADEIAALLKTRGHAAIVAPLLSVHFQDGPPIELAGIQAILATSANGVRALSQRIERRDLPLFAVGPQTAEAARRAGFASIKSADGDAVALAKAVPTWVSARNGPLLHASGADGGGRLAKMLHDSGFTVRTEYLYKVESVAKLPAIARDALTGGSLDAVLVFSPRGARTFANCVEGAGLAIAASDLVGVCISEAAATALAPLVLREIRVAAQPNQSSLLNCLG